MTVALNIDSWILKNVKCITLCLKAYVKYINIENFDFALFKWIHHTCKDVEK